jgi:hypothetical protein
MKDNIISRVFYCIVFFLLAIFIIFRDNDIFCKKDFGPEMNERRKSFNIPILPKSWHIKNTERHSVYWIGKYGIIGHEGKTIVFSGCKINEEVDLYILKPQNSLFKSIEIISKYLKDGKQNNRSFSYRIGDNIVKISLKKADSIFTASKINKDY